MTGAGTRLVLGGVAAALLASGAGCGQSPAPSGIPPACMLLTAADIQAAVHAQPSQEGGSFTATGSSCVWALTGAANSSISAVEIACASACAASRASLAPSPAFADAGDILGPGVQAWLGGDAIVVETGGSLVEIVTASTGTGAAALESLARSALAHLG
jgi:hypothetical protein